MRHQSLSVQLGGLLGAAQAASADQRLAEFIRDEESEALALFLPVHRDTCATGDWYGEHVGKWLFTVAETIHRDSDGPWRARVQAVLAILARAQEPSGYLGTYAPDAPCRFTHAEVNGQRTWDLWVHAWLLVGLTACAQHEALREAALRLAIPIGDLIDRTFSADPGAVIRQGNHQGLSSLVILEPLARLSQVTGDDRYVQLAAEILDAAHAGGLPLLANPSVPIHTIGTGKIYQLIWVLQGVLAVGVSLGRDQDVAAVERLWAQVQAHHLTPFGGPWGGIATHKEVFNPAGFFHPSGLVETCSSTSWLMLSQDLFLLTGDGRYVSEIERTAMNALLGAMDPNGRDWCYFTFPNGRRNNTYHWACCKSSGAIGLEKAGRTVVTVCDGEIWLNQWVNCTAVLPDGTELFVDVKPDHLGLLSTAPVNVNLRIPDWVSGVGQSGDTHLLVEVSTTEQAIPFSVPARAVPCTYTLDHHGQEIVREDYVCITRGPYVYAAGKVDGYDRHPTLRLPQLNPESALRAELQEEIVWIQQAGVRPIRLEPFYRAGGTHDSAWRTVWFEVAWQ